MKKPESKRKFIASVIFMIMLVVGLIIIFGSMSLGKMYIAIAGYVMCSISFVVLSYGGGILFDIFFKTIFGKEKDKS